MDQFAGLRSAGITSFIGAFQLLFDLGGSARTHDSLKRRYLEIASQIEQQPLATADLKQKYKSAMVAICADEPPVYRAVDAIAHNQIAEALYGAEIEDQKTKVRLRHRLTCHVWRYANTNFV